MNKKIFPWIPVVGIFLTIVTDLDESGLSNPLIFLSTAVFQALSCAGFAILIF